MISDGMFKLYRELQKQVKISLYSPANTRFFDAIYSECLNSLLKLKKIPLVSRVDNKEYFAFESDKKISRAVNKSLFVPNIDRWHKLQHAMESQDITRLTSEEITQIIYTMAISFCACIDLLKKNDQKTPGTFFEYLIAYFFSWRVGVEPKACIQILNIDGEDTKLPTDFIFNLGSGQRKFHMPIKTSTRERAIMLWAHQRLIDGIYGNERFMGTPVILAETKTDSKKREVIEICLPDQWRVYQLYIAKLKRIYYLDLPTAYAKLNEQFPPLAVQPFANFFFEWSTLSPT